jgi:hypothetical protein
MLGRIRVRDQASLRLSKIGLDTDGHVYYIHDILAGKFRVFWSENLVLELCCSSRWREMPLAKDGIAVQVVSRATLMYINRNHCVTERHSSVTQGKKYNTTFEEGILRSSILDGSGSKFASLVVEVCVMLCAFA